MLRKILVPLLLLFADPTAFSQLVMEDFENGGSFDLSNVQTYCMIGMLQGSTDTHGGGSTWSVEFPFAFQGSCPLLTPGIFVPLTGVAPGDQFTVDHWQKQQSTGSAVLTVLVYSYPATGVLPADPMDLQYASSGTYWSGTPGSWLPITDNFQLPLAMPWPSDVFLAIHVPTDSMFMTSTLVDDVTLTPAIGTGIGTGAGPAPSAADITIAPQPAMDRITIRGLSSGPVQLLNSAGSCVKMSLAPFAEGVWDIHDLPPGMYFVRQQTRYARFMKG